MNLTVSDWEPWSRGDSRDLGMGASGWVSTRTSPRPSEVPAESSFKLCPGWAVGAAAPASSSTQATVLEQVLTKLSSTDNRLSNLENKSTTSDVLSSEGSPAQGGRPPGASLRRALEGPAVEEME